MAAITADNTAYFESKHLDHEGFKADLPVAASTAIYKNSLVGLNATGYLVSYLPKAQALTPTYAPFVGVALEAIASQTSDGDATCSVLVSGYFEYALSAAAQLDVGKPVFALDNATLTKIGLNNDLVGTIVGLPSAGNVLVDMASPAVRAGIAGGIMYKRVLVDVANVINDEVYLVHETENHNGLYLNTAFAIVTEAMKCATTAGVITLVHTIGDDTTLGCTLTMTDNGPVDDLVQGSGGLAADGASAANMIPVPADVAVIAKVTAVNVEAGQTGQVNLCASFIVL